MRRLIPLFVLCSVLAALSACGNKGPLVMPPRPATPAATPAPASSATAPAPASTVQP